MAKRIAGVSARLLDCAREEFLEKGFQNASLREIARKADTSPRAIYTRFPNKEGLFDAIVGPAVEELIGLYRDFGEDYWVRYRDAAAPPLFTADPTAIYGQMVDYIYDHAAEFRLAIRCLDGTRYTHMIETLTALNCAHLAGFAAARQSGDGNSAVMPKVLQILTQSFYTALFEPLLHDMSRDEAHFYLRQLCSFYVSGIRGLEWG